MSKIRNVAENTYSGWTDRLSAIINIAAEEIGISDKNNAKDMFEFIDLINGLSQGSAYQRSRVIKHQNVFPLASHQLQHCIDVTKEGLFSLLDRPKRFNPNQTLPIHNAYVNAKGDEVVLLPEFVTNKYGQVLRWVLVCNGNITSLWEKKLETEFRLATPD